MKAKLALEDGLVFEGDSFGIPGERFGEVVFNTSMTGYQEVLTDPSYKGQILTMTYPLIGNYGVNKADVESKRIYLEAFVVKEVSAIASSWRSEMDLGEYLTIHDIMGIQGIDTRMLTKHIRCAGAMRGVLSTEDLDEASLVKKAQDSPGMIGRDLVQSVTCSDGYTWPVADAKEENNKPDTAGCRVIAIDFGIKYNILRCLYRRGCQVQVVPAFTPVSEIEKLSPDGVVLSNGPGDPEPVQYAVETVKKLFGRVPVFGICLGHQILGLAFGGKTFKLKFGHRGGNQPVLNLRSKQVEITAQNHGFAVDTDSLDQNEVEITHINLNDNTLEGMAHKTFPAFSVQYHPESSPGPHDSRYLFDMFIEMMKGHGKK